jgi:hypothetical protein
MGANSMIKTQNASSVFSKNVVGLGSSTNRVLITEPIREWRSEVEARLSELAQLERGWDGYQGVPVSFATANFALRMLEATCGTEAPTPQIVPGTCGDLQVEWHVENTDIEIHVRAPYDVHAWRLSPQTGGDGEEVILTTNFIKISEWVKELAEPSNVIVAAAI